MYNILLREQEVAGSNPVAPTIESVVRVALTETAPSDSAPFFVCRSHRGATRPRIQSPLSVVGRLERPVPRARMSRLAVIADDAADASARNRRTPNENRHHA